jgi:NADH-quinone oxidoreductase subunit E
MSSGLPIPKKAAPPAAKKDPRAYFTKETIAKFEALVKQYPRQSAESMPRAALIPILHHAQDEKGWLSIETIEHVAAYLGLAPIQVWETASFYPMFHRKPVGRNVVWVCRNIACDLRGAPDVIAKIRERFGIGPEETTEDGRVTLKLAECLGGCTAAPVMEIGGQYHENLTPAKATGIIDSLK